MKRFELTKIISNLFNYCYSIIKLPFITHIVICKTYFIDNKCKGE